MLEKTFRSPFDCKEIQPVHSEGDQPWDFFGRNDTKAETQYFGHLMGRVDSLEKTLILGGIGGRRKRGRQRWLDGITNWMDVSFSSYVTSPGVIYMLLLSVIKSLDLVRFSSVAQSCPTLCDPMNCSMPGLPVHHKLPEFTQTHVHQVGDAIQPSHPLSSRSPRAPNPSQHQSVFQ